MCRFWMCLALVNNTFWQLCKLEFAGVKILRVSFCLRNLVIKSLHVNTIISKCMTFQYIHVNDFASHNLFCIYLLLPSTSFIHFLSSRWKAFQFYWWCLPENASLLIESNFSVFILFILGHRFGAVPTMFLWVSRCTQYY